MVLVNIIRGLKFYYFFCFYGDKNYWFRIIFDKMVLKCEYKEKKIKRF